MRTGKIFVIVVLSLFVGVLGCTKGRQAEGPKQDRVEKSLVPPKAEAVGQSFSVELTDLKVNMMVDTGSKEIVETPKLGGNIKIINKSDNILDIQGVTLEYLDNAGKPIPFSSGEKISKVSSFWQTIKPGGNFEGSIDATIPRAAVKEKALGKIEISAVYVPSPLKRETFTIPEKIE